MGVAGRAGVEEEGRAEETTRQTRRIEAGTQAEGAGAAGEKVETAHERGTTSTPIWEAAKGGGFESGSHENPAIWLAGWLAGLQRQF
jgi:hypothetical protein